MITKLKIITDKDFKIEKNHKTRKIYLNRAK